MVDELTLYNRVLTLAEIQGLLPAGTTLLEYLVGDSGVVLWVVDRERAMVVHLPGDRQGLITQVRRFRVAITKQAPLADVQSQARALYRRLLEPARKEIRGERIVIVSDGVTEAEDPDALVVELDA